MCRHVREVEPNDIDVSDLTLVALCSSDWLNVYLRSSTCVFHRSIFLQHEDNRETWEGVGCTTICILMQHNHAGLKGSYAT
jgi:hypothetical protein